MIRVGKREEGEEEKRRGEEEGRRERGGEEGEGKERKIGR